MAGPRTLPGDLKSQTPLAASNSDLAESVQSPELARIAMSEGASGGGDLSHEDAQSLAQSAMGPQDVTPNPQATAPTPEAPPEELSHEEAQALAQQLTGAGAPGSPYSGAPAPSGESSLSRGAGFLAHALMGPVVGTLTALSERGEKSAPLGAKLLSAWGKDPQAKAQIFSHQSGLPTRIEGGEVQFQRPGEDWKPVHEKYFKSLSSFMGNLAEFAPDVADAAVASAGVMAGATAGAAYGASAGPAGIAGGGVVGGYAAGGPAAASAALSHEAVSHFLGADPDVALGQTVATQAAIGALVPVFGGIAAKGLAAAGKKVVSMVKNSALSKAINVGELTKGFEEFFDHVTGGRRPGMEASGDTFLDASARAFERNEAELAALETMAVKRHPNTNFPLEATQGLLEKKLRDSGVRMGLRPQITKSDPQVWTMDYSGVDAKSLDIIQEMGGMWKTLQEDAGTTPKKFYELYKKVQAKADFQSALSITPAWEREEWRDLYMQGIRPDRGALLKKAVAGSDLEPVVESAFKDYSDKSRALEEMSKAIAKSPEKVVDAVFTDVRTAQTAKSVLNDAANVSGGKVSAWEAVRTAKLAKYYDAVRDKKTEIVDIAKFYDSIMKNEATAKLLMSPEQLTALKGMASIMRKTSWTQLLQNSDSIPTSVMARGMAGLIASKGHPYYMLKNIADMVGHDPKILKEIEDKGIMRFASEAKTEQERSFWLKASRGMAKLRNAVQVSVAGDGSQTYGIPVPPAMIPVLLNAGVRSSTESAGEKHAAMSEGYQTYLEHMNEQAQESAQKLAQEQAEAQARAQTINPQAYVPMKRVAHSGKGASAKSPFGKISGRSHAGLSRTSKR